MKREVRTFNAAQIRAKEGAAGASGYAAVFNSVTDLGWFREVIKPGAFTRAISEGQDVRCLQNHDENIVLGRTKSKTLSLSEDERGLKFECDFPDTQQARDLHTSMDRGDVDQCSFGFVVRKQTWTEEKLDDGSIQEIRQIEDADLFDVSIVTYPAYVDTSCEARSLWPDGVPEDVAKAKEHRENRSKRDSGCQCECPECQDGDCMECSSEECDDPNCEGSRSAKPPVDPEPDPAAVEAAAEAERINIRLRVIQASL